MLNLMNLLAVSAPAGFPDHPHRGYNKCTSHFIPSPELYLKKLQSLLKKYLLILWPCFRLRDSYVYAGWSFHSSRFCRAQGDNQNWWCTGVGTGYVENSIETWEPITKYCISMCWYFFWCVGSLALLLFQWMTAGRGIIHSEMPEGEGIQRGLQLWINLTAKDKM